MAGVDRYHNCDVNNYVSYLTIHIDWYERNGIRMQSGENLCFTDNGTMGERLLDTLDDVQDYKGTLDRRENMFKPLPATTVFSLTRAAFNRSYMHKPLSGFRPD